MPFKPVEPQVDFAKQEHAVLDQWAKANIFQKSIDNREKGRKGSKGQYVFFDGPPGTNGVPHIGHMMQSALKDVWPRFKTMQGYQVLRKAGWDTHGLPVELQAEKELGLDGKKDIHNYGMAKYIGYCRNTVFRYLKDWEKAITRIGRFLDMSDAYATLTNDFIQTDWWVIKQAHEKGLLYKDFKILPYCARCGTGLSSHEVAQGYQEVTDTSVYVRLPFKDEPETSLLVWTTTPWTLLANVAVAAGSEIKYVRVRITDVGTNKELLLKEGERLIIAKELLESVLGDAQYETEEEFDGHALAGKHYNPPFNYFDPKEDAFYVVVEDFVTVEDGSGLVHMAAYGEDDFKVIKKYKLPLVQHVDMDGHFKKEVTDWAGKFFKDTDKEIVRNLRERSLLMRALPHEHSYPFCWRCKTPLIYNAQSSWFIKTTAFKDKMLKANSKINWQPDNIKNGRFGKWLEDNVDWAVSRSRYWGSPLPVWTCQKCEHVIVVESVAELREKATAELPPDEKLDLHKPFIDNVKLQCGKCDGQAVREPDVLDCWFNAGVMPWGQWGYPAKPGSKELYDSQYPADFICEAIDQTRGWFYVLLATSVMLTGESSYKNVICTGHIADEKGQKMSKSLGNVIEPMPLFEKFGADAVRWSFFRTDPWNAKRYGESVVAEVHGALLRPLWNVYSFFVTYANIDKFEVESVAAPASKNVLDKWIMSELDDTIERVTEHLEAYDIAPAAIRLERFIEGLSNWYVRRSRRRFWKSEDDGDKQNAEATLYYALVTLSKLLAPFAPFVSEQIYRNLTGGGLYKNEQGPESVHLADWPVARAKKLRRPDEAVLEEMRLARRVVSLTLKARQEAGVRVRQPLSKVRIALPGGGAAKFSKEVATLVSDEVNVKELEYVSDATDLGAAKLKLNFAVAGKKYGADVKKIAALLVEESVMPADKMKVGDFTLEREDVLVAYEGKGDTVVSGDGDVLVALDVTLTEELRLEGLARELIRFVQELRKEAGYEVEQHIQLAIESGNNQVQLAVEKFGELIAQETLATDLTIKGEPDITKEFVFEKRTAHVGLKA